jgi:hypothetical protein
VSILFPGRFETLYGARFLETDPAKAAANPAAATAEPKAAEPAAYEPPKTQADLDALIGKEKAKAERAAKKEIDAAVEAAKAAAIEEWKAAQQTEAAKEQGEFKTLYESAIKDTETLKAKIAELENDKRTMSLSALRSTVAAKHGLPAALADRLQGETEEALEADAKALAAVAKTESAPNTEGGKGKGTGNGSSATPPVKSPTHRFSNRNIVPFAGSEAHAKEA